MTNLRCTADHHAVTPLNIRPVESGIIPDHFLTGRKTYPAHLDLSERARPTPLYFRPTYALPDQGPLIVDPSIFPERRERGLSALWCERALKPRSHQRPDQPPLLKNGQIGNERALIGRAYVGLKYSGDWSGPL